MSITLDSPQSDQPQRYVPTKRSAPSFWRRIGLPERGVELQKALAAGFPYHVFERLGVATGTDPQDLRTQAGIPRSTLQRREQAGRFTQAESDCLYRIAEVYLAAVGLFAGHELAARHWLSKPTKGLGGAIPTELLQTMAGTELVLDLIGRLEHGVVA